MITFKTWFCCDFISITFSAYFDMKWQSWLWLLSLNFPLILRVFPVFEYLCCTTWILVFIIEASPQSAITFLGLMLCVPIWDWQHRDLAMKNFCTTEIRLHRRWFVRERRSQDHERQIREANKDEWECPNWRMSVHSLQFTNLFPKKFSYWTVL